MLHTRSLVTMLTLLAATAACGKDEDSKAAGGTGAAKAGGDACPALKVTIDGQEVTGLTHGLAITQKMGTTVSEQVQLFNHDKATCEEVLSKSGRTVPEGEIAVRANAGNDSMSTGVGIDSHAQLGGTVTVVGPKPSKPGDQVTLCAKETTFTPRIGAYKDKPVTIAGALTGTYCGVMEL